MKHTLKITTWLIAIFFITQIIGLLIINQYIDHKTLTETGEVSFENLPFNFERPPIEEGTSFIFILIAILLATGIVLLLIKFRKMNLWKLWYLIAVIACMTFAFFKSLGQYFALLLSIILGYWKVFRPNVIIHNLSEIFIYGGLAAIFVPIMNVFAAIALLLLISIYDMYAVWTSKHMVAMAKFQTDSNVFAGLHIPYKLGSLKKPKGPTKTIKVKSAVLGGGDIGFPLIFAGVVMKELMITNTLVTGFLITLIIPLFATIALTFLLIKAQKDKFYPAMPFITAGCLLGYAIVLLF